LSTGELPGPYREDRALCFVRGWLIPEELLDRHRLDLGATANWLGIPVEELQAERAIHRRPVVALARPRMLKIRRRPA
jgi:hypothetical protein